MDTFDRETLMDLLDTYKDAIVDRVYAEVNASRCRTKYDYNRKREALEHEGDILETIESFLRKME